MDIAQMRARLQEIQAKLGSFGNDLSDEDQTEIETLHTEFKALGGKLEAAEKLEEMKAAATPQARKVAPTATPATPRIEVGASAKDRFGGFDSSGQFLSAVRRASGGDVDNRFKNVMYEKNAEDGGFLVPEDISTEILKKLDTEESLFSQITKFNVSGNSMTLTIDESQPWNAGIQAYWVAEGGLIPESKPKFTNGQWRLHKLGALVKPTDELLEDAVALESYIKNKAPEAIMHKLNAAIVSGDGAGKPKGFLNSGFAVTVAAEGGQSADTIVARNIINMYTRMLPAARAKASWYINAGAEAQLLGLKDDNGNFIYLAPGSNMNSSPYGMLMGRPVIPMMSTLPALGDSGDIIFADLSYYYGITKVGGVKQASSIHLHFDREITCFRFTLRVDGNVPFQTPVTTEYGAYQMSAFVKLVAR